MKAFDPGPFLRAVSPGQPPTIEGKFDVSSKLTGRAINLAELVAGAVSRKTQEAYEMEVVPAGAVALAPPPESVQ
ncbi:MAG: hypothetical protein ABR555_18550, partial [Pyrinomonadaceae bacterium]